MKETLRIIGLYLWLPVQMFLLMIGLAKPPKDETPENQPPVQKGFGHPPKEP